MTARRSSAMTDDGARGRHPSNGWQPNADRLTARVAEMLASEGHAAPDLAAAVLAERGRLGLDRSAFATTLGIDEQVLRGVEDGTIAAAEAPAVLRALGPPQRRL